MFFNKIFHFVKGYVIIEITGFYIERFLYICAKRGIKLFSIGKRTENGVAACISISDFYRVRPVRFKTGTHIRIIKKCGLPFLIKQFKKRSFLIIGLLLVAIVMFISSNFIWSVEIRGDNDDLSHSVAAAVRKTGVHIGAYKPSLMEGESMKSIILNNTENLVWAWVYINGTKAVVEYKEGILPPKVVDKSSPCDIVARRDGLIVSIVEKSGRARVMKNDTVEKGDLLIAGTIDMSSGDYKTVHAIGDVYAYTWHEKSGEYKMYEDINTPTGKEKKFRTFKLFSKCFDLFFKDDVNFENYTVSEKLSEIKIGDDNYLGIGMYEKTYSEVTTKRKPISYDIAVEKGRNDLEEKIAKELACGSRLTDKKVFHEQIDNETVKVTVTMEYIKKIGEEIPIIDQNAEPEE